MTRRPEDGDEMIENYIARLPLNYAITPIYYRQALNSFRQVAVWFGVTDRQTLEYWLRERGEVWARSTVQHRARIVARFLDALADDRRIESNPISDLRRDYNAHSDTGIIRALMSPDPNQALEALRQPRPFESSLGELMRDHVERMQRRGYRYEAADVICRRFDRFLQQRPDLDGQPLETLLEHYRWTKTTANHPAECEKLARILNKALCHDDPSRPKRQPDNWPAKQVARGWRRPYIYSSEDIQKLLAIARVYPSPRSPSRAINLYTMLVLAYCAGLRIGEIARLTLGDVDMRAGTIAIRETKFFKSRILPLSDSAMDALRAILEARQRANVSRSLDAGLFWHDQKNRYYCQATISNHLVAILRMASLKPATGKTGPRIHDLRHTFVVHRILEWYRQGENPQEKLPYLATYLGHRDINSTLVYITVTQELLHEASERFRAFATPGNVESVEVAS
ncbi:tyrosine-type recombinase/integrase [Tritonibacter scottomollicae]|uniref:Phage integrase family protein n=1 Tax=Tritonibacter scottomollicae TaxID=483013 RepID=A0A2T1AAK4_TRISK|nr:tyrosine-type recombinase/integrase [Tritonibacter scottomollicae]PRZ45620.1 phage integrase family protein [Tritonibacter scottomollicae]WOI35418.1 tyrosine-type recombinase/integrase [Tritonibacter scottomollicae]